MAIDLASLRRVYRHKLTEGLVLPGNLMSRNGQVMVAKGTRLDEMILGMLKDRMVYSGPDWVEGPPVGRQEDDGWGGGWDEGENPLSETGELGKGAGEEEEGSVAQCELAWDAERGKGNDRRRRDRKPWEVTVKIDLQEDTKGAIKRTLEVKAIDLGSGGFAFMHRQYIHPMTYVKIRFNQGSQERVLLGVVRYCINLGGVSHRVGVEFVSAH